ncbi:cholesterol esterase [Streptomyces fumigatiscleroticus]|nr:cholesterol esterase [Streptomyces fumigatiscleroticus]
MESQVRGGTRWKRFAVVMVPSVAATAAIGVALAQGALAASFSVSGQSFKVTAERLEGDGFSQYGAIDQGYTLSGEQAAHPVAVSAFSTARIQKMCQSVVTPNIPVLGSVTLKLTAGDSSDEEKQVHAENLYIDVEDLETDATFTNIDIGVAGKDLKGPKMKQSEVANKQANPYGFAQQAEHASLLDVKQTAWATTAGTFKLSGLKMSLSVKGKECY